MNFSVTAIIPSDRDTADVMPGDLSSTNSEGDPERLESSGEISFHIYVYNYKNKLNVYFNAIRSYDKLLVHFQYFEI